MVVAANIGTKVGIIVGVVDPVSFVGLGRVGGGLRRLGAVRVHPELDGTGVQTNGGGLPGGTECDWYSLLAGW